jgi:hypothetical protein
LTQNQLGINNMRYYAQSKPIKKKVPGILFIIISILISNYTLNAGIIDKQYQYTTGKFPAVAASKYANHLVEVHGSYGSIKQYYAILTRISKEANAIELPSSGFQLAIAYSPKNPETRENEIFTIIYCADKVQISTKNNNSPPKPGVGSIYMMELNPYTKKVSKPSLIVKGYYSQPGIAFISSGKYSGCLALVYFDREKNGFILHIINRNRETKYQGTFTQNGCNPSIAFIETGPYKGYLAQVHQNQNKLFMNIINLETLENTKVKNEIAGISDLNSPEEYAEGEYPTVTFDYKRRLLITVHNDPNSSRLNIHVYSLADSKIKRIKIYNNYGRGYAAKLTYSPGLGIAEVHKGKDTNNLWISFIKIPDS